MAYVCLHDSCKQVVSPLLVRVIVLFCAAPSIANVQAAIEHIYPLVVEFRMDPPRASAAAAGPFCGGSAPTYASHSRRRLHNDSDDDF